MHALQQIISVQDTQIKALSERGQSVEERKAAALWRHEAYRQSVQRKAIEVEAVDISKSLLQSLKDQRIEINDNINKCIKEETATLQERIDKKLNSHIQRLDAISIKMNSANSKLSLNANAMKENRSHNKQQASRLVELQEQLQSESEKCKELRQSLDNTSFALSHASRKAEEAKLDFTEKIATLEAEVFRLKKELTIANTARMESDSFLRLSATSAFMSDARQTPTSVASPDFRDMRVSSEKSPTHKPADDIQMLLKELRALEKEAEQI